MGTAVSKRKNLRNDAISSVAAKVRAAKAFGDYLSHTHPENCNGSDHLLSDTLIGPDTDSLDRVSIHHNTTGTTSYPPLPPHRLPHSTSTSTTNTTSTSTPSPTTSGDPEPSLVAPPLGILQPPPPPPPPPAKTSSANSSSSKRSHQLCLERSFSAEEDHQKSVELALQPARVYTITGERGMLGSGGGSKESLELDVLRGAPPPSSLSPSSASISASASSSHRHGGGGGGGGGSSSHYRDNGGEGTSSGHGHRHGGGNTTRHHHHHLSQAPLQSSVSAHNIRGWGESSKDGHIGGGHTGLSGHGGGGMGSCGGLGCEACGGAGSGGLPSRSQGSLDLESSGRLGEAGKQHRHRLERMHSVDRVTGLEREDNSWFPKENMFSFQTATTTMQALSNFRKHLRMVGSRRMKAQTFAERRAKSFNRSWSDPTPVKQDNPSQSPDSGDVQASCAAPEEAACEDMDWEEEREMERLACEGNDFIPPKVILISSKVPKAEYVPNIIRRDDPSIIPILYDHEHATFDDILEEIDKRLTAYRRGSKIWQMLIFCQGGPGHLYLLKNKVATFAKVEKEEDMSQFWRRLSRFMSKINPEPNLIHVMGCYVLGNPNGEKLFHKLKTLMRPCSVTFHSPLELSSQGKEMIEMYFDFRLFRLWKTRQHSKHLDYEDL
ncbi:NMDA receptor synaptonuclear signaling and neuronal migration factor [Engraulis encrasicolus]|uniref:NMDA receptor synaptonuclear signaling and neuronal migration factor n=1 Tax=Engraulis encrasicolus TaxID=184585 RepID=UPI002FD323E2